MVVVVDRWSLFGFGQFIHTSLRGTHKLVVKSNVFAHLFTGYYHLKGSFTNPGHFLNSEFKSLFVSKNVYAYFISR
jgi:hypothetical protein